MCAIQRPRLWPRLRPSAALLLSSALALAPAHADERRDHDRARAALQAGEVMSLQKVLEKIQRSHPGELLEAELEREDGRWVYELKWLQTGGSLVRLDVDAKTGNILKVRQRSLAESRPPAQREPNRKP